MQEAKIGILGLGAQATLHYIKRLNTLYQSRKGTHHTFPFLLLNANFDNINPHLPYDMERIDKVFRDYLNELMAMGKRHLLIPNITLHELLDEVGLPVSVELIHPVREAEAALRFLPGRPLMIWGSKYSMQEERLPKHFEELGETVLHADKADQQRIDDLRKKVYKQGVDAETQEVFNELVEKYRKEARILLACTELSIFEKPIGAPDLIDMAQMQIERALFTQIDVE